LAVTTTSPDETQRLAARLAVLLEVGDVLSLTGELGAGKTCFTQGLGTALGVDDRMTSPTFTLANAYPVDFPCQVLHHVDAYRLESLAEAADLDLASLFDSGATVIEWGELLSPLLPDDHLALEMTYPDDLDRIDNERHLRFRALGQRWHGRAGALEEALRL